MEHTEKAIPLHSIGTKKDAQAYVSDVVPPITSILLEHSAEITKSAGDRKFVGWKTNDQGEKTDMEFAEITNLKLNLKGELILKALDQKLAGSSLKHIVHEQSELKRYLAANAVIEAGGESEDSEFPELSAKLTLADKTVAAALEKTINRNLKKALQKELAAVLLNTGTTVDVNNPEEYRAFLKTLVAPKDAEENWGSASEEFSDADLNDYVAENLTNGNILIIEDKLVNKKILQEQKQQKRMTLEERIKAPGSRRSLLTVGLLGIGSGLVGAGLADAKDENRQRDANEIKATAVTVPGLTPTPHKEVGSSIAALPVVSVNNRIENAISQAANIEDNPDPYEYQSGRNAQLERQRSEQSIRPEYVGSELPNLGEIQVIQKMKSPDIFTPGDEICAPEIMVKVDDVIINGVSRLRVNRRGKGLNLRINPRLYKGFDKSPLSPESSGSGYTYEGAGGKRYTVAYETADKTGFDSVLPEESVDSKGVKYRDYVIHAHSRYLKVGNALIDHPTEAIREYVDETIGPLDRISVKTIEENCDQISGTVVEIIQPDTGKKEWAVLFVDRIAPDLTTKIYNREMTTRQAINEMRRRRNIKDSALNLPELPAQSSGGEIWLSGCANRVPEERREPRPLATFADQVEWEQAKIITQLVVITEAEKNALEKARTEAIKNKGYVSRAQLETYRQGL